MCELLAEQAALRLIARAEQSVFGLSRKLKKRGHEEGCIRAVVSKLQESGLVDDRRYAQLWLESRLGRSSSPWRLRAALYARGIEKEDADFAMEKALDEETQSALLARFVQKIKRTKKIAAHDDSDAIPQLKYILKNEGFSPACIQAYFDSVN